jgi:hypothetical protein
MSPYAKLYACTWSSKFLVICPNYLKSVLAMSLPIFLPHQALQHSKIASWLFSWKVLGKACCQLRKFSIVYLVKTILVLSLPGTVRESNNENSLEIPFEGTPVPQWPVVDTRLLVFTLMWTIAFQGSQAVGEANWERSKGNSTKLMALSTILLLCLNKCTPGSWTCLIIVRDRNEKFCFYPCLCSAVFVVITSLP